MIINFYLFRVSQGQCGALRLPDGSWCLFDLGSSRNFSPVQWLAATFGSFRCQRLTLSHLHYHHLADYLNLFRHPVATTSLVAFDQEYFTACLDSCSQIGSRIHTFICCEMAKLRPPGRDLILPHLRLRDRQVPLDLSRRLASDPQAVIDNAGLVTRLDIYGRSLLLPGDLQHQVWDSLLGLPADPEITWREFLSNIDVLVAPCHGQPSGFSPLLLALARPRLILIPATDTFPLPDQRYYHLPAPDQAAAVVPVLSTAQHGHLRLDFQPPARVGHSGSLTWTAALDEPPSL